MEQELSRFRGVIALERVLSRKFRRGVVYGSFFLASISFVTGMFQYSTSVLPISARSFFGFVLICVSVGLVFALLSAYWNSLFFWGITRIGREGDEGEGGITYEVAEIVLQDPADLTGAFLRTLYGRWIMLRVGVVASDVDMFLANASRVVIDAYSFEVPSHTCVTFEAIASHIFAHDAGFKEFLFSSGVREDIFFGAVAWVSRLYHEGKHKERWWGREMLGKTRGIGSEFSFGIAFELRRFMGDLELSTVFSTFGGETSFARDMLKKIEQVLSRAKEANVLLVAEPGVGEMDILATLAREMQEGGTVTSVEGKHMILFDATLFLAAYGTKQEFEQEFIYLMNEAAYAGNLVFVIQNIGAFLSGTETIGVDLEELIDPYLVSTGMQVIATIDPHTYHQSIENRPRFMQRFVPLLVESPPFEGTVRVLEDIAPTYEAQHDILFTYSALYAVAEGAERYIVEGVMPDKAVDVLVEISATYRAQGLVTEERVHEFMRAKTGIPMGQVTEKDRDILVHLEQTLHEYVVGQNAAIDAISDAMRRARAGVQTQGRPMGSFLFLGSTGVGKTETAKALARVFFGDETRMLRLDMSEYSGGDALSRLVGSAHEGGALPAMLHEHPYGVLLLDEFEKAAREVHDIFLQILDEGMFTDGRGQKINARNTIIIATSNAGSDMLFEMVHKGIKLQEHKEEIVAHIIEAGVYRPELINRFDGTIIFESLTKEELVHIARLMIKNLAERIKQKGYVLEVTDSLIDLLVLRGYDPAFGVRPMRRVIQEMVEGKVAERIISGVLRPGEHIVLSDTDFSTESTI